jgi:hypothetical protein
MYIYTLFSSSVIGLAAVYHQRLKIVKRDSEQYLRIFLFVVERFDGT